MVKFGNTYAPPDWNGAETGALMRSWPKQLPNEHYPKPPHVGEYGDYSTSAWNIGSKILSRADQSYTHPEGFNIAGKSKRITSFYRKTGVSEHRSEPGFRDTKGFGTYTEINGFGPQLSLNSFRSSFENTASLVLTRTARERLPDMGPPQTIVAPGVDRAGVGSQGGSVRSQRSRSIAGSQKSALNYGVPTIYASPRKTEWDWDPLPMYHTCNQLYGQQGPIDPTDPKNQSAGKSLSGFLTPNKIQAAMKHPGECIAPKV